MAEISGIQSQRGSDSPWQLYGNDRNQERQQVTARDEETEVQALKEADRKVRAHEAAHLAASGGLARGGANYSFKQGPDGQRYAVAGEVNIDISPVQGKPQATIQKMQQVIRAALAPSDPSPQDRAVASAAARVEAAARQESQKNSSFLSPLKAYVQTAPPKSIISIRV